MQIIALLYVLRRGDLYMHICTPRLELMILPVFHCPQKSPREKLSVPCVLPNRCCRPSPPGSPAAAQDIFLDFLEGRGGWEGARAVVLPKAYLGLAPG